MNLADPRFLTARAGYLLRSFPLDPQSDQVFELHRTECCRDLSITWISGPNSHMEVNSLARDPIKREDDRIEQGLPAVIDGRNLSIGFVTASEIPCNPVHGPLDEFSDTDRVLIPDRTKITWRRPSRTWEYSSGIIGALRLAREDVIRKSNDDPSTGAGGVFNLHHVLVEVIQRVFYAFVEMARPGRGLENGAGHENYLDNNDVMLLFPY